MEGGGGLFRREHGIAFNFGIDLGCRGLPIYV